MDGKNLNLLITDVIAEMSSAGFAKGTQRIYNDVFKRLQLLAKSRAQTVYTSELGEVFINDNAYSKGGQYCHSRFCLHSRCIQFLESLLNTGSIDWSINKHYPAYKFKSEAIAKAYDHAFCIMTEKNLKPNTIDGYLRFIRYFLQYLEARGYQSMNEIQRGNIIEFITLVCTEHYQPTSLGAHITGLKVLLESDKYTSTFIVEIPERLLKKRTILEVYSDDEYEKIKEYLTTTNHLSYRNRALCILALETGLRAVDICNLKISDIDWEHDCISIVQEKTSKHLRIPLSESIGNALVDYLLSERPNSTSDYVFLRNTAPYLPIITHSGCRNILRGIITDAGIEDNGRIYGTRITRHSTASRMLRHGIPLPVIAEALGHNNQNSTMIYITTDDAKLAECTLPLPKKKVQSR